MRTFQKIAILLVLFTLTTEIAQAQRFTKKRRYWALGGSLNAMNYFGDIVPRDIKGSFDIDFTRPTIGAFAFRKLTPNIGFKAGLTFGTLIGDDYTSVINKFGTVEAAMADPSARYRLYRNLHFRNRIVEVSGLFSYSLRGNKGFFYQREKGFNPYITAGIAITYSNPQAQQETTAQSSRTQTTGWVSLRDLNTEAGKNYIPIVISIPVGLGVRYKVNNKIDIGFEAAFRFTTTDYLDDVSGRFGEGTIEEKKANLSFRGEDQYTYNGIDRSEIIAQMNAFYGSQGSAPSIFAAEGERRGNDGSVITDPDTKQFGILRGKDIYLVYGFNLYYMLGGGISCPKFR